MTSNRTTLQGNKNVPLGLDFPSGCLDTLLNDSETAVEESIMDTKKHPPKLPTLPKNSIAHKDPSLTDMCLLVQVLSAVK